MKLKKNNLEISLSKIRSISKQEAEKQFFDVYRILCREETLVAAYEKIKSNKGSLTVATTEESLDGISIIRIQKLLAALKDESWKPKPARRINIPKVGKKGSRPLGIQGPEEKIVQAAVTFILEAIYEPIFLETSFGFRPGRGVHDALKKIDDNYDGKVSAIEGDIKGMYDNVNHPILIKLLEKKIKDPRFIRLIWKLLRTKYMEGNQMYNPFKGTPQGSIVSPILANIYLHELDVYMEKLMQDKIVIRSGRRNTPEFKRIRNLEYRIKTNLKKMRDSEGNEEEIKSLMRELKKNQRVKLKTRKNLIGNDRITYTRYADDFIIGLQISKKKALEIKEEVKIFLESLQLTLSEEKTKITDLREESAFFLGYRIRINKNIKFTRVYQKHLPPHTKRVTGKLAQVYAPIDKIIEKLNMKGFSDDRGNPKHKTMWITQPDNRIIELFNYTVRGIFNFYSGAHNQSDLNRIWYILKFSCAKTLAAKHRTSSRKIRSKHGRELKIRFGETGEKSITLFQPKLKKASRKWMVGRVQSDPFKHIAVRLTKTKIYDKCCICGEDSAEMHHSHPIRNSKKLDDLKSGFTRNIMGKINRKQIPVCLKCHDAIHAGRYDSIALKDFVYPKIAKR